ncbi:MAG: hypothetical protein ACK4GN_12845 [Runella sp.]
MKNVLTVILVILAAALGYWWGQKNAPTKEINDVSLLKSSDLFSIKSKDVKIQSKEIDSLTAKEYTSNYGNFIKHDVILSSGSRIPLRDVLHPAPAGSTKVVDIPYYRIESSVIRDIMSQPNVANLCIFPALKPGNGSTQKEFTLVLVGEDAKFNLLKNKIYDEVDICPPPTPCKEFLIDAMVPLHLLHHTTAGGSSGGVSLEGFIFVAKNVGSRSDDHITHGSIRQNNTTI